MKTKQPKEWQCQECGLLMTIGQAERASIGTMGCRKCGGADIGLAVETVTRSLWKPYEMGEKVVCRG